MLRRLKNPYRSLEKEIGYSFRKRRLLQRALTHRSFRFENRDVNEDNQRLEFLGDAVLGFVSADYLFKILKEQDEGVLTSVRSRMSSGKALAEMAERIGLGQYLHMGKGEENSGGRMRGSNLADALESVLGAVFLDGGLKGVQKTFKKLLVPWFEGLSGDVWADNPKGELQEYSQRKWKKSPQYRVVRRDGPSHAAVFAVEVSLPNGRKAIGKGGNKQEAESHAAGLALKRQQARGNESEPRDGERASRTPRRSRRPKGGSTRRGSAATAGDKSG